MTTLTQAPWLAVVVPFALAGLLGLFGRFAKPAAPVVASLGPVLVIALGIGSLVALPGGDTAHVEPWTSALASQGSMTWFKAGETSLSIGWAVDSLAAIMLLVVGVVALMVMVFSAGYMAGDRGWVRYYALLALFTGSMTLLVIGDSFTALFVGWELVGACSYLLIGFWYEKPTAAAAAIKAFLTTRLGDVGLLLGIAVLWAATGSLDYVHVMESIGAVAPAAITAAAILVAVGAIGKSAQFPLHIWLPDAMEGPTPVSALIHAATMVAAGVYLVARTWPLFAAAPAAQTLLLTVGVISALGAALIALAQRDIKKVLAYSTISQLGFMFAALGVGAWEVAFFHLVAHAAFKSLLFLASGSVIHGAGTQDLREMGGLRRTMPVTFAVWLVGGAALVGIPPLAGFFSKDAVLDAVWIASPAAGVLLFAAALLTGYYTVRATKLTFFGQWRGQGHSHESPLSMLVPLVILAVPAATLGFAGAWVARTLGEHPEPLSIPLSAVAVTVGLVGGAIAWKTVRSESKEPQLSGAAASIWRLLGRGFGYDAAVMRFVVHPTVALCRALWAIVDRFVIDGVVEGSAVVAGALSGLISKAQTGDGQAYAAFMTLAVVVVLCALLLVGEVIAMTQLDFMVLVPAAFAVVSVLVGRRLPLAPRWIALFAVVAQCALIGSLSSAGVFSGARVLGWDGSATLGVWQVAIDGLSLPLVLLTLFIGIAAVVSSWNVAERPGAYFALILTLQAAVTGVFLAESLILFYVAWESVLVPMYFLIGGWGSSNRRHAATKYLLYTFAAGGVMLLGVILTLIMSGGSTSIAEIVANNAQITAPVLVFWLFMAGFLVKIPSVPFHTWLPDAHTEAPTAGSIILAGVMLKMGGYGVLRIAMPFAPTAFDSARGLIAVLGIVGIVYGAAMALVQTDLKRLVAYSSVAHMGFVLLAIAAATTASLGAAMLAMVSHGFVAGLLFLLVGTLYDRTHTRELGSLGGLGRVMPVWSVVFVFGALASAGLPGLSGFPGEFVTVLSGFAAFGWWTAVAAIGLVLGAAYNLRAVRGTVQGPVGRFDALPDLSVREMGLTAGFSLAIVALGVQPTVVLSASEAALSALAAIVNGGL